MVSQFKRSISLKLNRIEIKRSYGSIDYYREQWSQWLKQLIGIYTSSYSTEQVNTTFSTKHQESNKWLKT